MYNVCTLTLHDHLDSNIKDVVRDEVDRQLLQQQFMGDVMKFNNMSMGTSSAQGFTPQLGNKDEFFVHYLTPVVFMIADLGTVHLLACRGADPSTRRA